MYSLCVPDYASFQLEPTMGNNQTLHKRGERGGPDGFSGGVVGGGASGTSSGSRARAFSSNTNSTFNQSTEDGCPVQVSIPPERKRED